MYIIIEKRKYYKQMEVPDYCGRMRVKIIDKRYKRGRILFAKIFHRHKSPGKRRGRKAIQDPNQRKLGNYGFISSPKPMPITPSAFRLPYRHQVRQVGPDELMAGQLSWAEIEALQHYSTATGYLKDLFLLNNFQFWNNLDLLPHQEEVFGRFFIGDLVKLEVGRCKLGYLNFTDWIHELETNPTILMSFSLENERIPDSHNYGRLVSAIGALNVRAFHGLLVQECESYELVDYQIGIWDGRFFKSNCGGHKSKQTGVLSDPDCGKCVKGKYKGAGYLESPVMDWKCNLIVYYDVIPANRNDKIAFRETFQGYLTHHKPPFTLFFNGWGRRCLPSQYGLGCCPGYYSHSQMERIIESGGHKNPKRQLFSYEIHSPSPNSPVG